MSRAMKPLLIIIFLATTIGATAQQYAPNSDTIIDGKKWVIRYHVEKHGMKWTSFEPVDTSKIDNLQYHRDKVFFYLDSLLWVESRMDYCESCEQNCPCHDSIAYYMNYWNNLIEKSEQWQFIGDGKNVLSSFPERPLSEPEEYKLSTFMNHKNVK